MDMLDIYTQSTSKCMFYAIHFAAHKIELPKTMHFQVDWVYTDYLICENKYATVTDLSERWLKKR